MSVLLVEQNSRMALRISQRAYALTTGKIVLSGNSEELISDERVKKLYLGAKSKLRHRISSRVVGARHGCLNSALRHYYA